MCIILQSLFDERTKMPDPVLQQEVLDVLLAKTQPSLWEELNRRNDAAYSEAFAAVKNDARILPNQKAAKLLDERFYLCERALHDSATPETGAVSSGQKITINHWVYTIVRAGPVLMIQSYVPTLRAFARPAKFREQHAALNDFLKCPQFSLGDLPTEFFDISSIGGMIVHGPLGRAFTAEDQKMGFLRFCVPSPDYRHWEVDLPVGQIIGAFGVRGDTSTQRDIAKPKPRDQEKKAGE
jgi:hypothetical protein